MSGRILWLDNDPAQIWSFVRTMRVAGMEVTVASTVSEAEEQLRGGFYDILLLDVMIPVTDREIATGYGPRETDDGLNTGLAFYVRNKHLVTDRTAVLVLSVRVDGAARAAFIAAGLPPENFITKFKVRDASVFLDEIRRHLHADPSSA